MSDTSSFSEWMSPWDSDACSVISTSSCASSTEMVTNGLSEMFDFLMETDGDFEDWVMDKFGSGRNFMQALESSSFDKPQPYTPFSTATAVVTLPSVQPIHFDNLRDFSDQPHHQPGFLPKDPSSTPADLSCIHYGAYDRLCHLSFPHVQETSCGRSTSMMTIASVDPWTGRDWHTTVSDELFLLQRPTQNRRRIGHGACGKRKRIHKPAVMACQIHKRLRKTRLRPENELLTGIRKYRCERCSEILAGWVRRVGVKPTPEQKDDILKEVGMNRQQLHNWFSNRRREEAAWARHHK